MSDVNPFQSPTQAEADVSEPIVGEGFISDTSCGDNFGQGWKMMWASFGVLLGITILHAIIKMPGENLDVITTAMGWPAEVVYLSIPYAIFISLPLWIGVSWAFVKGARRQNVEVADMFSIFSNGYWNAIGALLLKYLVLLVGFVALIIPGVILSCRLAFVEFLIIDRKLGPYEAIQESWRMTRGHGMTIFLMWLLSIPIAIVGLLLCLVGVVPASMWILAAFAVLYNTVAQQEAALEVATYGSRAESPEYGRGLDFT